LRAALAERFPRDATVERVPMAVSEP